MSGLTVEPVSTRRQKKLFLNYPWQLYRDDPLWVPPLRLDQEELVGYRHHPFYDTNEGQTFLAYRDGKVCGRIMALLNQSHIDFQKDKRGFFGFFECEDDQEAANLLFDAARDWFAEREIFKMRGPMNPSINYTIGTLVEGFDTSPTFMMTYNPPYYEKLITNWGFSKAQDFFSFLGDLDMLSIATDKLFPFAEQVEKRFDVKVRLLNKSQLKKDVHEFMQVYNRSMTRHWGFSPMSEPEVQHMAKGLRFLMVPELAAVAEIDGRVVASGFSLPDYNPRIKKINGSLFPFGFMRLLWNRKAIKSARAIASHVVPEYQAMGISLVLTKALMQRGLAWGMNSVEWSWVAESNNASRGALEKGGAKRDKTFRVYDWDAS